MSTSESCQHHKLGRPKSSIKQCSFAICNIAEIVVIVRFSTFHSAIYVTKTKLVTMKLYWASGLRTEDGIRHTRDETRVNSLKSSCVQLK